MKINNIKKLQKEYNETSKKQIKSLEHLDHTLYVLKNADTIIDTLDREFTEKTGINNSEDINFILIASILQSERSRKLFKSRVFALFLLLSHMLSSQFQKTIMRNFQNTIDIVSKLCGAFDDPNYGHQMRPL